jgi:hypothetical protein
VQLKKWNYFATIILPFIYQFECRRGGLLLVRLRRLTVLFLLLLLRSKNPWRPGPVPAPPANVGQRGDVVENGGHCMLCPGCRRRRRVVVLPPSIVAVVFVVAMVVAAVVVI